MAPSGSSLVVVLFSLLVELPAVVVASSFCFRVSKAGSGMVFSEPLSLPPLLEQKGDSKEEMSKNDASELLSSSGNASVLLRWVFSSAASSGGFGGTGAVLRRVMHWQLLHSAPGQCGQVLNGDHVAARPPSVRCGVISAASSAWLAAGVSVVAETLTAGAPGCHTLFSIVPLLVAARAHAFHSAVFTLHPRTSNTREIWHRTHHLHADEAVTRLHVRQPFESGQADAQHPPAGGQGHAQVDVADEWFQPQNSDIHHLRPNTLHRVFFPRIVTSPSSFSFAAALGVATTIQDFIPPWCCRVFRPRWPTVASILVISSWIVALAGASKSKQWAFGGGARKSMLHSAGALCVKAHLRSAWVK